MDDILSRDRMIDIYSRNFAKQDIKYTMMAMMLDPKLIDRRLEEYKIKKAAIYGAGPLGVQFYRAIEDKVEVTAFVDDGGSFYCNRGYSWGYNISKIKIFTVNQYKDIYQGEKVVIADFEDLEEMRDTISEYVNESQIVFINEFLYGGASDDIYN
jgi:hypothetical protein